ncbi:MAG: transaldolase, partial [Cyanobacteria bacterium]|nr:transaldolase [Cyanobacteriota bacterium]
MKTAKQVSDSRVRQLTEHGQSIWLDFIRRSFVQDGGLRKLVDEDGLRGVTSNPSIFEKAIAGSNDYTEQLQQLFEDKTLSPNSIYERLAVEDIRAACDILRPVYEETKGRDGYVSMEVSPLLASDSQATIDEARRLWKWVDKPNLMVKVPGTPEGIPAIKTLISEGININVTLLFSRHAYRSAAEAYMEGLEELSAKTGNLSNVASVASFFVSRIDSSVDKLLKEKAGTSESDKEKSRADNLRGKAAIANAKLAYEIYRELFTSERWKTLVEKGARPQRLLWASTSTKDPSFPDTLYVDELIGNETVNTLPMETLEAFRDHGKLADTLESGLEDAKEVFESLERLGISFDAVTDDLLADGVDKFAASFRTLLEAIRRKRREFAPVASESMTYGLPESLSTAVKATVKEWTDQKTVSRLWSKDSSLWTNTDERNWLDWLTIVDDQLEHVRQFQLLQKDIKESGFKRI